MMASQCFSQIQRREVVTILRQIGQCRELLDGTVLTVRPDRIKAEKDRVSGGETGERARNRADSLDHIIISTIFKITAGTEIACCTAFKVVLAVVGRASSLLVLLRLRSSRCITYLGKLKWLNLALMLCQFLVANLLRAASSFLASYCTPTFVVICL